MFAPGAAALAEEFHITSATVVTLAVSIYLCGFAIGPMVIAPLSELYGRLIIYHTCYMFYIGFIIGCALSTNTGMFLTFRFLAGCASSGPLTVGGGTVADVVPPAQRGKAMSLFLVGPLIGPVRSSCIYYRIVTLTIVQGHGSNYWRLCVSIHWLAMDVLDHHNFGTSTRPRPSLQGS